MSRIALKVHFHICQCQVFNPIDRGGGGGGGAFGAHHQIIFCYSRTLLAKSSKLCDFGIWAHCDEISEKFSPPKVFCIYFLKKGSLNRGFFFLF